MRRYQTSGMYPPNLKFLQIKRWNQSSFEIVQITNLVKRNFREKNCITKPTKDYRKVVSTSPSRLEAHTGFFRLSMKENLMFIYCDLLGKNRFPYHKHALIFRTLRYLKLLQQLSRDLNYGTWTTFSLRICLVPNTICNGTKNQIIQPLSIVNLFI